MAGRESQHLASSSVGDEPRRRRPAAGWEHCRPIQRSRSVEKRRPGGFAGRDLVASMPASSARPICPPLTRWPAVRVVVKVEFGTDGESEVPADGDREGQAGGERTGWAEFRVLGVKDVPPSLPPGLYGTRR